MEVFMNKLVKTLLFTLLMGMPIVHGGPNPVCGNNVKPWHKNIHVPQQVYFERCKDENMYKKLLENEKLINLVLSKYKEIKYISVGVNEDYFSFLKGSYISGNHICLDPSWFEEDDDVKQFIFAHELAHYACGHRYLESNTVARYSPILVVIHSLLMIDGCVDMVKKAAGFSAYNKWLSPITKIILGAAGLLAMRPYLEPSQRAEQEADIMAAERLGTTEGGIKFFKKKRKSFLMLITLGELQLKTGAFTHPSFGERIAYLQEWQSKHQ